MSATLFKGLSPQRTTLPNGAVVTVQETSMTPAVTISAAFRPGSLLDPDGLEGLAYLMGRVLDRGTERRRAEEIAEALDDRGVSLKISTNRQAVTLSCTLLSEDFNDILALVIDVVRRPVFPDQEIEKGRAEAVTALRQNEDNPGARAADGVMQLLYTGKHPYGRPSKGTVAGVERITRADITSFHRERIVPAALSLVIVGDVPASHALTRAALELEGWITPAPQGVDLLPPSVGSRHLRRIAMPGKPQADIAYGFTTVRRHDPRYYAYWVMNNVLGQFGLGGRLADNIRERQGMAYYAFSTLDARLCEAPLLIRAGVDPDNVERTIAAIDHEVSTLAAEGPTAREIEESRAYLVGSLPRMLETNQSIADFLQTSEEFSLGLDYDQCLTRLLNAVTREQVAAAAAETLDAGRAAIAVAGPEEGQG